MKRVLIALAMTWWAGTALAHQLNVFAFVEGDTVIVETKFSNGNIPLSGQVRVLDADSALVLTLPLQQDGTARFPLDPAYSTTGLSIEVETGEGHDDYWILTPDDIARGTKD